ncbi:MAG: PepSY domain-containing protein [Pyrinomonadaceae bacterium]|nr:PepSY domain-containing protein [Pyrinomonadaceae bacterium]
MKSFRKILFWLHLCSGVIAGIVIFIMCVTGALLSFEKNIVEFAEREMRRVAAPTEKTPHLSVTEILSKVRAAKPEAKPSNITLPNESNAAWHIALGREGQLFVNPYTGEIIGEGATGVRGFFRAMTDLHRWIALSGDGRPIGKAITGASNLMFLFLAISGIFIWFPRRLSWRHLRAAMVFRRKVKGRARDFNWHTVIGFWSSLILIILTLTATVISYQWAGNLLYTLTGNETPQQQQALPNAPNQQAEQPFIVPENLDAVWTKAIIQTNWKTISLRLPITKDAAIFTIDEGIYWNIFGRSTLTIDAKTAEVSKWESYGEQNSARQLRSWFRFTHTGETGGFIGQLIGFLACLGGAILVYTGLVLAWRRFRNWRS